MAQRVHHELIGEVDGELVLCAEVGCGEPAVQQTDFASDLCDYHLDESWDFEQAERLRHDAQLSDG